MSRGVDDDRIISHYLNLFRLIKNVIIENASKLCEHIEEPA